MQSFSVRTKGNADPHGRARVYFTCHPEDFDRYFDKICEDVFLTQDCAIYYTENMSEALDESNIDIDLGRMSLFLVPVTFKLMNEKNRAMAVDIAFAKKKNITILPFMMESGIDGIYSLPENFGERQYLNPFSTDSTEVRYEEKLKKILEATLISDEMAQRVRDAFDAYVFLSYRKKDRKYANQLMRIIHSIPGCRDIAIWYDEFLTPGESFLANIESAMEKSELFALLVTPNILEDGNFVMREEYPAARRAGMTILPAEMEKTDHDELGCRFENIPTPVTTDDDGFADTLLSVVKGAAISENDADPEHIFLIGLAYLDGIDVEVDVERGVRLITTAAEAGLPEAMEKIHFMYDKGDRVPVDFNEALKWAERLADYYVNSFGEDNEYSMMWIHNLAHTCVDLGDYARAIELQKRGLELTRKNCGNESYETVSSLNALAQSYLILGSYGEGIALQQESCEISERVLGEGHIEAIGARVMLAQFYFDSGNIDDGIKLLEKAVEVATRHLGDRHSLTLIALSNLANNYSNIGRFDEALEISTRVYNELLKTNSENHPSVLTTLNNIALIEQSRGNLDKAIEISIKVINSRRALYGDRHPDVLRSIGNLATIYNYAGKSKLGMSMLSEILEPYTEIFGENHHEVLLMQSNLAFCHLNSGNIAEALSIYERVCRVLISTLGEAHPDTLLEINNLISVYIKVGEFAKAKEMLDRYYTVAVQHFGKEHPTVMFMTTQLADLLMKTGDNDGALELFEEVYPTFCSIFGEGNPETLTCLGNIAMIYSIKGRLEDAKRLQSEILSCHEEIYGRAHPDTVAAANNLGYTLMLMEDFQGALRLYDEMLKICIEELSQEHPLTPIVMTNLATAVYRALGDTEGAIRLLVKAFSLREKIGILYHPDSITLLEGLCGLYLIHGRDNECIPYLERLYNISLSILGEEHPKTAEIKDLLDKINGQG